MFLENVASLSKNIQEIDFSLRDHSVLIIDDSETNIKVLGALLKKHDLNILTAIDPFKGISIAESKLPDIILLDIMMPEINGFEVAEKLKNNPPTSHIPIIYLSSLTDSEHISRSFNLGAVDYITKPFDPIELITRIKYQLKVKTEHSQVKSLFNSKHYTFILIDQNYKIINFNSTANEREYLLTKSNYKIGDNILDHIDENDRQFLLKKIRSVFLGKIAEFERNYLVNGAQKWFHYTLEPIRNNNRQITSCLFNGIDITQKKEIELKEIEYHKKINSIYIETQQSLSYASYIQKAIIPDIANLNSYFSENFILFKPKEKVSGDFYWTCDLGKKYLLALGDCTGHGVPGALLTTISIVLLERIVKYQKISSPEKILYELNNNIIEILNQKNGGIQDGLEMSICLFDKKNNQLEFAGAKRSIFITSKGEIHEIKGDRLEIGGQEKKKFIKQSIPLEQGSSVYLFSDGIIDQIGGENNKKFLKKKLSKLILSLASLQLDEQNKIITQNVIDWIGDEEQTDDILLIGVKI